MKVRTYKSNGPKDSKKYQRTHARNLIRKEERRMDAEDRQAVRDSRFPEEQLAVLAKRPGNSGREKSRLEALMRRN